MEHDWNHIVTSHDWIMTSKKVLFRMGRWSRTSHHSKGDLPEQQIYSTGGFAYRDQVHNNHNLYIYIYHNMPDAPGYLLVGLIANWHIKQGHGME